LVSKKALFHFADNCMKSWHPITANYSRYETDINSVRAKSAHQICWYLEFLEAFNLRIYDQIEKNRI
jgi:hypothetical protein